MKSSTIIFCCLWFIPIFAQDQPNLNELLEASNVKIEFRDEVMDARTKISADSYHWELPKNTIYHTRESASSKFTPLDCSFFISDNFTLALQWTVKEEIGVSHYVVERYHAERGFEFVQVLGATGNSENMVSYQSKDPTPHRGFNSYRLVQVLSNGAKKISITKSINYDRPAKGIFLIASTEVKAKEIFVISDNKPVTIFIANEAEEIIGQYWIRNRKRIDMSDWPKGIYRYDILGQRFMGHGLITCE